MIVPLNNQSLCKLYMWYSVYVLYWGHMYLAYNIVTWPHNTHSAATILCLSQASTWISICKCCGLFVFNDLRRVVIIHVGFVDIGSHETSGDYTCRFCWYSFSNMLSYIDYGQMVVVYGYGQSHICGGSDHCAWPEVTSVTWPEVTSVWYIAPKTLN
jgi:hypothetical protein